MHLPGPEKVWWQRFSSYVIENILSCKLKGSITYLIMSPSAQSEQWANMMDTMQSLQLTHISRGPPDLEKKYVDKICNAKKSSKIFSSFKNHRKGA